jgi:hypothetical protein
VKAALETTVNGGDRRGRDYFVGPSGGESGAGAWARRFSVPPAGVGERGGRVAAGVVPFHVSTLPAGGGGRRRPQKTQNAQEETNPRRVCSRRGAGRRAPGLGSGQGIPPRDALPDAGRKGRFPS